MLENFLKEFIYLLEYQKNRRFWSIFKTIFKLIKKRKRNVLLVSSLICLILKHFKNRKIKAVYSQTETNRRIFNRIKPLLESYSPTMYLPFGFMKILWLGDRRVDHLGHYRRQKLKLADGEIIALDFYPYNYLKRENRNPVILFVPGIFGDSYQYYCYEFCKQVEKKLGWTVAIYNRRGYGNMQFQVKFFLQ